MEAHNQQQPSSTTQADEKVYVSPQNLRLGNEGIFLQASRDNWIPISSVNCDSQGIYLMRGILSWSYYICKSCGKRFPANPIECDSCGCTDFDFEYEDYWDRRTS